MWLPDIRRVAAVDMYGSSGAAGRRSIVRTEFIVGAVAYVTLGLLALLLSRGWGLLLGAWLLTVGMNYVPLAISARSLSRPGALEAELVGIDLPREAGRARIAHFWILVPLAPLMTAIRDGRRRERTVPALPDSDD